MIWLWRYLLNPQCSSLLLLSMWKRLLRCTTGGKLPWYSGSTSYPTNILPCRLWYLSKLKGCILYCSSDCHYCVVDYFDVFVDKDCTGEFYLLFFLIKSKDVYKLSSNPQNNESKQSFYVTWIQWNGIPLNQPKCFLPAVFRICQISSNSSAQCLWERGFIQGLSSTCW